MTGTRRSRRQGCGIGCGIALLLLIIVGGLAGHHFGKPIRQAKRLEQDLNDRFAYASDYVPAPDGSLAPQRVEAFLRVRERIHAHCVELREVLDETLHLDGLEEEPEAGRGAALLDALGSFRTLLGAGPRFLRFMNARNGALLDEDMGLGEYMYIYVLAYSEQLGRADGSPYAGLEEAHVSPRAREDLTRMLRNQLAALESGGAGTAPDGWAERLRGEILALEEGRHAFPWPDGPPPAAASALAPRAARLRALFCPGLVKLELMQKNRGLEFRG